MLRLERDVFTKWAIESSRKREKDLKRRRAARFRYCSLLRKGLLALRGRVLASAERLIALAQLAQRKGRTKHFYAWRSLLRDTKSMSLQRQLKNRYVLERAFYDWQYGVVQLTRVKREDQRATHHYQRQVLGRIVRAWLQTATAAATRRQAAEVRLASLLHGRMQARTLEVWREHCLAKTTLRFLRQRASGYYQNNLLRRLFEHWIEVVGEKRWSAICRHQASAHDANRCQRAAFRAWRQRLEDAKLTRAQHTTALVHWKDQLQARAFRYWRAFQIHRAHKRNSRHEALEWRRRMFLQQGLLHWATAGFRLREQRVQAVAQEAASRAQRIWQKVAQIASHWRFVALRGRCPNRRSSSTARYEVSPTERTLDVSSLARISRPPPRKPVDLLVNDVNLNTAAKYDMQYSMVKSLAAIQTLVRPTDATSSPQVPANALFDQDTLIQDSNVEATSDKYVGPATSSTMASTPTVGAMQHPEMALLEMEGRLHYWQQKKLEWRTHKHQMQAVRSHLNSLRANDASTETIDVLERVLVVMEATHADHQAAFLVSKKQMLAYTDQIQRLRMPAAN